MRRFTLKASLAYLFISGFTFLAIKYLALFIITGTLNWAVILTIYGAGVLAFGIWVDQHTRLIEKLNQMAHEFARGRLTPDVYITTDDELGQLNMSLHNMADNIRRHLQKTLQEKDQMATILASMVEGVLAFDNAGRLMLMNKTAEDMLGVSWEQVARHFFLEILRNHQLADLLKRCLSDGKRQVMEVKLLPTNPEYYRVYITPIIGKDGYSQGAIMVLRNVTKVRLLEQVRSEFVANVSHELRTPLTSIKGYVETLLDGAMDNRGLALQFLEIINTEADRLNRLINDLLYLSHLETGRMEVAKKPINSQAYLDKVFNLLKPVAKQKQISLESVVDSQTATFLGNQDMMEQVLINLLENAIKYSYDGGTVRVEIGPHEQGIFIKVIDWGIGIPAESLPRLFERFYRVDKARSRQVGGTGLGLSIVKHIVERHRGQVQVESEVQKGTVFTVILPTT